MLSGHGLSGEARSRLASELPTRLAAVPSGLPSTQITSSLMFGLLASVLASMLAPRALGGHGVRCVDRCGRAPHPRDKGPITRWNAQNDPLPAAWTRATIEADRPTKEERGARTVVCV
jgi:hypothetical protein